MRAESPISGWPDESYTPSLWIRWAEGKLSAFIVTGMQPAVERSGEHATATIRFDKHPAEVARLNKSTDGEALFWGDPKLLIKKLLLSDELLFRFTPFNSSPTTTTFRLAGLKDSIAPLVELSRWTPPAESFELIMAEQGLRKAFSRASLHRARVDGLTVRVQTEGRVWKSYFRDGAVIDLARDVVNRIQETLPGYPGLKLKIEVRGTTWTPNANSDGGKPFRSNELAALVRQGVARSGLEAAVEVLDEVKPEFYDEDDPDILRGKLKASGEHFIVIIEGIE